MFITFPLVSFFSTKINLVVKKYNNTFSHFDFTVFSYIFFFSNNLKHSHEVQSLFKYVLSHQTEQKVSYFE